MDLKALWKLSYGLYVIGVKNDKGFGGCIVDAVVQATSEEKPKVIVCCMNSNKTKDLIKQHKEITLSVLPNNVDPFVIANFGYQSSKNTDKWSNVEHTSFYSLPVLKKAASCLFLKLVDEKQWETHTVFTLEVQDAYTGEGEPLIYGDYQKNLKDKTREAFMRFREQSKSNSDKKEEVWVCTVCGYIYDGDIPFEDLPNDYTCPRCGQPKEVFEKQ